MDSSTQHYKKEYYKCLNKRSSCILTLVSGETALTGKGVIVAVIDSGVDVNHEDLQGKIWINSGEIPNDGIDNDNNGYIDDVHGVNVLAGTGNPLDDNNHGTHCSGTIGGVGNK